MEPNAMSAVPAPEQKPGVLARLADSDLVLAQRLGEWVGKGPVLEEDIASTNVGLDLLGQARLWYGYAGEVEARVTGNTGRDEDQFAFRRDAHEFRNLLLVEQPNGNYADTIARQFLFDHWHVLALRALERCAERLDRFAVCDGRVRHGRAPGRDGRDGGGGAARPAPPR